MKLLVLRIVSVVLFASQLALAQVQSPSFPAQDEGFRNLVWSILGGSEVKLYPNALSPDLPVAIPLPENTKIIGTRDWGRSDFQVYLDVPLPTREAIDFYRKGFSGPDWSTPRAPIAKPTFGFEFAEFERREPVYEGYLDSICHKPSGFEIYVSQTSEPKNGRTQLQIGMYRAECNQNQVEKYAPSPAPLLKAPEGSQAINVRSIQNDLLILSNAVLRTNLETTELLAHYEKQWESKSWKKLSSQVTKTARWSLWTLEVGERVYLGMMYANAMPGQVGVQQVSMFVGNLF